MDKLVEGWIIAQGIDVASDKYDAVCWAIDELFDLAHDKPDRLLKVVVDILSIDSSQKVIGSLGAGVLEELLLYHGDRFIENIIELSDSNPDFRKCLSFVYIDEDDVSPRVYSKMNEIKGK